MVSKWYAMSSSPKAASQLWKLPTVGSKEAAICSMLLLTHGIHIFSIFVWVTFWWFWLIERVEVILCFRYRPIEFYNTVSGTSQLSGKIAHSESSKTKIPLAGISVTRLSCNQPSSHSQAREWSLLGPTRPAHSPLKNVSCFNQHCLEHKISLADLCSYPWCTKS